MVPVSLIVVPTSFFNDLPTNSFFTNAIRLVIPLAPNVFTKLVSNVNRTDKLKMYIFRYIVDEFGVLRELIRYMYIGDCRKIELRDAVFIVFSQ